MKKKQTIFNSYASKIELIFGRKVKDIVRRLGTAVLTPLYFSKNTGHFKSSLSAKAITNSGRPLPWLTYPALDFLAGKDFSSSLFLEFGGGQSTVFWSSLAKEVITFEEDKEWIKSINKMTSHLDNLQIFNAPKKLINQEQFVLNKLKDLGYKFDVIIVDGMHRKEMFEISTDFLNDEGMIICDDAESFPYFESWQKFPDFMRIDFYGHQPGVIEPHSTSILFKENCRFMQINSPLFTRSYNSGNMPSMLS